VTAAARVVHAMDEIAVEFHVKMKGEGSPRRCP
jgi:hypothetical protein